MKRFVLLIILIPLSIAVYVLIRCNKSKDSKTSTMPAPMQLQTGSFVRPPIPEADISYSHYTINAEFGGTIEHPSGSTIVFPANAFVDANGNIIKGNVDVRYREFPDPAAMILSGIPMRYDSAGITYQFESSGMCDIRADKNGKALSVNPKSRPTINMISANANESFNLYVLDTTARKWIPKGKPVVFVPQETRVTVQTPKQITPEIPLIKPEKPTGSMPIVHVLIDKGSFKELGVYDNMKFQIDENEKSFNPQDADLEWEDVSLNSTKNLGHYQIIFKKGDKKVSYAVHPVFEGKDYNLALKKFEKLLAIQKKNDADKKIKLAHDEAAYIDMKRRNEQIEEQNKIIAANNKIVEQKNREEIQMKKRVEKENEEILAINAFNKKYVSLYNSFVAENFGIWNCDRGEPVENYKKVLADYFENGNKKINPELVFLVYRDINTCVSSGHVDTISIAGKGEQMLFAVTDNAIGYISPDAFAGAIKKISKNKVRVSLTMFSKSSMKDYKTFIRSKMKWKSMSSFDSSLLNILSFEKMAANDSRLTSLGQ